MPVVYVDVREKGSGVPEALSKKGVSLIFKQLDVGDYIVSSRIGIERKTAEDYIKSLIDGRLFDQARRLAEAFEKPIIIIEGSLSSATKISNVKRSSVLGSMLSLGVDYGIFVVMSRNVDETAEIVKRLALKEQPGGRFVPVRVKKPKLESVRDWQLFVVQCLPHVGPKIAERLLEVFGSVQRICNASASELSRIEGLGEKRAAEIVRVLRTPYSVAPEERPGSERERGGKSILDFFAAKEETSKSVNKDDSAANSLHADTR